MTATWHTRLVIFTSQRASKLRRDAEELKEISGYAGAGHPHGAAVHGHIHAIRGEEREVFKRLAPLLPIVKISNHRPKAYERHARYVSVRFVEKNEPLRTRVGQRTQQQRIHQAEYQGGSSDSEGKRESGQ